MEHLSVIEIPAESKMSQAKGFCFSCLIFSLFPDIFEANLKFERNLLFL